ncbi:MAG: (Fe-S)-binding protein, partial [Rhodospirillales bacterium]|nr:(Fe-S)-binding protein [Rhodospirillales bacterium]
MAADKPKVGLFVTCLVDVMRPAVGFAAVKLLQDAGCDVVVPQAQTCCGQPAYNSGDSGDAAAIARQVIEAFAGFDYVVAPSGSCVGTIKEHYPELFADDPIMAERARELAARTYELTSFLNDVLNVGPIAGSFEKTATYHDSCSGLRELGVKSQPRTLLSGIDGLA